MSEAPPLPSLLPWQATQWLQITNALKLDRLHHALLLHGPAGVGKSLFARRVAAALLCESSADAPSRPCGECRSCVLVRAGNHPDLMELAPREDRRMIDVEQVRTRIAELSLTAHYADRRVIVINPADGLNHSSANSLLKTLEEPPGSVVFLLLSARPAMLAATIRSRCSSLMMPAPERAQALTWLREQGFNDESAALTALHWCSGAPLAAHQALESGELERCQTMVESIAVLMRPDADPLSAAAQWNSDGLRRVVDWQLRIAAHAMRIKALQESDDSGVAMQVISSKLDLRQLDGVCEELLELRNALERQLNPGEQLALEGLAVTWRDAALKAVRN
ncbi:MAG: DNA polymerase-3 subunit delta' [Gammaproteobacteria bacterium]